MASPHSPDQLTKRIKAFARRTVVMGWMGGVMCGVAATAWIVAFDYGMQWLNRIQSGVLPPVHVPDSIRTSTGTSFLVWVFIAVIGMSLYGLSTGIFLRKHIARVLAVIVLVGIADFAVNTPTRKAMLVIPSELERSIRDGRFAEAERILSNAAAPNANYMLAQIALRANDTVTLKRIVPPLLEEIDRYVYVHSLESFEMSALHQMYGDLNAEVIHAVDVAVNGRPTSEVGIEYAKRPKPQFWNGWRKIAVVSLVGLGMTLAAVFFLRTWWAMRRRVIRVGDSTSTES